VTFSLCSKGDRITDLQHQIRRPQARQHPLARTSWWSPHVALRPSTASARGRGVHELVRTRSRPPLLQSPNIPSATALEPPAVTRHALTFLRRTRKPSRSTSRPHRRVDALAHDVTGMAIEARRGPLRALGDLSSFYAIGRSVRRARRRCGRGRWGTRGSG